MPTFLSCAVLYPELLPWLPIPAAVSGLSPFYSCCGTYVVCWRKSDSVTFRDLWLARSQSYVWLAMVNSLLPISPFRLNSAFSWACGKLSSYKHDHLSSPVFKMCDLKVASLLTLEITGFLWVSKSSKTDCLGIGFSFVLYAGSRCLDNNFWYTEIVWKENSLLRHPPTTVSSLLKGRKSPMSALNDHLNWKWADIVTKCSLF